MKEYLTCEDCKAKCCSYVAVKIDAPKNKEDCEIISWYLYHPNTEVFKEGRRWYLQFNSKCKNLDKGWHCRIYNRRPGICRSLKAHECENHCCNGTKDITFKNAEQFLKYAKKNKLMKKG